MSAQSEFFLNSRSNVIQFELLEVTHPNFTQPYRIVRNARDGVTVDLDPSELAVSFTYYPVTVEQLGARDDLDSGIRVNVGDLGETIPDEMDSVAAAGGFLIKPAVRYWAFRSDQLSAPIYGPMTLEIPSISFSTQGASFDAQAPVLNSTKTGERLTLDRIPMQRGFLMKLDVDSYLTRRFDLATQNCWHVLRDAWLELTGMDLGDRTPARITTAALIGRYDTDVPSFVEIPQAASPCIVLMRHPGVVPHVGLYWKRRVLQMAHSGPSFQPLHTARIGYNDVTFHVPAGVQP